MNLEDYGRLVRRHWGAIALSIGLGLAVAFGVSVLIPKVYTADASGFVVSQSSGSTGIASLGDAYAKSRAKSYIEIAKNRTIAQAVIGQLGLKTTPQSLVNQISASVPLDQEPHHRAGRDRAARPQDHSAIARQPDLGVRAARPRTAPSRRP